MRDVHLKLSEKYQFTPRCGVDTFHDSHFTHDPKEVTCTSCLSCIRQEKEWKKTHPSVPITDREAALVRVIQAHRSMGMADAALVHPRSHSTSMGVPAMMGSSFRHASGSAATSASVAALQVAHAGHLDAQPAGFVATQGLRALRGLRGPQSRWPG